LFTTDHRTRPNIGRGPPPSQKGETMPSNPLLAPILEDEALTRGLGDAEARLLVEWVVEQVEWLADSPEEVDAPATADRLRRRARSIGRFVRLWCEDREFGAATQLYATERFDWPLPECDVDGYDLMLRVLTWEDQEDEDEE
jgi:hypothetical protein